MIKIDLLNLNSFEIAINSDQAYILDLNKINLLPDHKYDLIFSVNQKATLNLKIIGVGQIVCNLNLKIDLVGINTQANVNGALLLNQNSAVNINILQNHFERCGQSSTSIKTVLLDQTSFSYTGNIYIARNASETVAYQENKNLVLSQAVIVKSQPTIEVLNPNVSCGHGSAIGELDQDVLLYLNSRGVDLKKSKKLLVESFLKLDLYDFNFV